MRVRMGTHLGVPTCSIDPTTGRMDYLGMFTLLPSSTYISQGSMVNKASRITGMAAGGQILLSNEMWDAIKGDLLDVNLDIKDIGTFELKGMTEHTRIKQILPVDLAERTFPPPKKTQNSNKLERQLKTLVKENERLKSHLNNLEQEFKQMMSIAQQMEKKYSKTTLQKELSTHSMHELLQAAVWNEAIHSQFQSIKNKIAEYHKDSEEIKLQLSDVIEQKTKLSEERDALQHKLSIAEMEKNKLMEELASRPETPVSSIRPISATVSPPRNTPSEASPRESKSPDC